MAAKNDTAAFLAQQAFQKGTNEAKQLYSGEGTSSYNGNH